MVGSNIVVKTVDVTNNSQAITTVELLISSDYEIPRGMFITMISKEN